MRKNASTTAGLKRAAREKKTISLMIGIYCRDKHGPGSGGLCEECSSLDSYAMSRVDKCPFPDDKPTCLKCPVHCYSPEKREKVRAVMRYSGPRMPGEHPYLAIMHLIDGMRKQKREG